MKAHRSARYCSCGTRLARDNPGDQCGACAAKARDVVAQPPRLPDEFWNTEQFHTAFAAQHIGQVSRAYRKHPHHIATHGKDGIPQEVVAGWLGMTQAQISRIENGPPVRHLDRLTHWARTLRIPGQFLWFTLPDEPPTGSDDPAATPHRDLVPPRSASLSAPILGLPAADGNGCVSAMQAFRVADRQVGGGHLYAAVVKYLQVEVAPRLFGVDHGDGGSAFTAAAALTEMAGWMAHDAGRDQTAGQHFARSLDLVRLSDDRQLAAHILASMSHLAHHRGRAADAIRFARRGQDELARGPRHSELDARLLAMQARGFAALQKADECTQLLLDAERVLNAARAEQRSPWVSHFDEGSLASEAARCLRQLGDLTEARRQAERIIALRPGDRTRSRAFGKLILASLLVAQGRPDEACAIAATVLAATQQLGSFLVVEQLLDFGRLVEPYRTDKGVADFLSSLEETLRERQWLYHWSVRSGRGDDTPQRETQ